MQCIFFFRIGSGLHHLGRRCNQPGPGPRRLAMTARPVAAGDLLGIPVLDHLIIGASCYSYADNGRLRYGV